MWTMVTVAMGAGAWLTVRPAPVPCDIAQVDQGPLVVTVDEDGRTRLKERYIVSAPLAGRADRITLKPGDAVAAGTTLLARISATDPSLLDERTRAQAEARVRTSEAAISRAEPELARCQAEVDHMRAEYERFRNALTSGASSVKEVEDELVMLRTAEHTRDAARFALQMAKYELEQARAALLQGSESGGADGTRSEAAFDVRSPITGKVLRVLHESAGIVAPGDALIELGSLTDLEVELDVLSDQAVRVRPGQRVSLERWGGDKPLGGVVRVVEPSGYMKVSALGVEEQRVNVIIDLLDPPDGRSSLGDNFRVEARIVVWETPDAVRVPIGALFRSGGEWAVYVAEAGRVALRTVTIGERSSHAAQVMEALRPGDDVIVYPSDRVADGVRVQVRNGARR
jgi:HlyD family secretion protein